MKNKIKCYNHRGKFEETYIPEEVCILIVKIITGDECIEMYREEPEYLDALEWVDDFDPFDITRRKDCFDAMYIVKVFDDEEFTKWNNDRVIPEKHYVEFRDLLYEKILQKLEG